MESPPAHADSDVEDDDEDDEDEEEEEAARLAMLEVLRGAMELQQAPDAEERCCKNEKKRKTSG